MRSEQLRPDEVWWRRELIFRIAFCANAAVEAGGGVYFEAAATEATELYALLIRQIALTN